MSGRRYRAALLITTAMALAGCSLIEQVIVIEPRKPIERPKEAAKPSVTLSRGVPIASSAFKSASAGALRGYSEDVISKSYSARYDSGPVLKPIKKTPENKSDEVFEDSTFVSAVKSWIKTGMQLPGWAGRK